MHPDPSSARRGSGSLEAQILATLWSKTDPMSGPEVHAALSGPDLSYKTVLTVLTRLHEKGQVQRARDGRGFRYRPVPIESDASAERMARLLRRGADRAAVLQGFLQAISAEEEELLRGLLDEHDRTGPQ